ncbi:DUF309 domain-containing protein [Halogeometricum borinquense]|uniref:DUF309 domain-containing protein n=1 Tax=Halogeometricum borinquense TaxID=60847 RepID=A0A6C0UJM5_9EURY|nr:DUF309 domain-containing protein [Halogeometricum borinquense]QIB73148.1 DUF309 domain-containing protein [Halogeometricum borinquense]QIQ77455.1 DUF309 domain-containing protein [Halogeometricum borinquense]
MERTLRVGAAVFNAGDYHAAHDAWEDEWLALEDDTADERLLHGLIQYTAAVHHVRNRNWSGAQGLATSASEYLAALPSDYRTVNVGGVRTYLDRLAADPEFGERAPPVPLTLDGTVVRADDLSFEGITDAAAIVAADSERFEEDVIADAATYGREEVESGAAVTRFVALLFEFVGDRDQRSLIYQRLEQHVGRRRSREDDVSDLFD